MARTITPIALRVTFTKTVMTVQAGTVGTPGNRKFKDESAFWYALKKTLMAGRQKDHLGQDFDLVKKVMSKDGHMVGGNHGPYYLRDRKWRYGILDWAYDQRDLAEELHKTGVVVLTIENLEPRPESAND